PRGRGEIGHTVQQGRLRRAGQARCGRCGEESRCARSTKGSVMSLGQATGRPGAGSSVLRLDRLRKEYRAGQPVSKDITLDFDTSGVTAIIGPSGTGKSTLIRCVNRLVDPTSGSIWFEGADIAQVRGSALRGVRRRIGMVFQEYNLVERLTVMENILTGR